MRRQAFAALYHIVQKKEIKYEKHGAETAPCFFTLFGFGLFPYFLTPGFATAGASVTRMASGALRLTLSTPLRQASSVL